jgi:hypothetical protein
MMIVAVIAVIPNTETGRHTWIEAVSLPDYGLMFVGSQDSAFEGLT